MNNIFKYLANFKFLFGLILIVSLLISIKLLYKSESTTSELSQHNDVSYSISKDFIFFENAIYDESQSDRLIELYKEDFPKLFENYESLSWIKITPIKAHKGHYIIANIYPDHGGSSVYYAIIVDVFNKSNPILYETSKYYEYNAYPHMGVLENGDVWLNFIYTIHKLDYGQSAGLGLIEYITFDNKENKYLPANTKYNKEIADYLEDIKKENGCSPINGSSTMTFIEIKEKFGEDHPCASSDEYFNDPTPGFADKPYNGIPLYNGITPKQYFQIVKTYEDILNSSELSIFDVLSEINPNTTFWECDDYKNLEIIFYDRHIFMKDENLVIEQTTAASGVRYANKDGSIEVWNKGNKISYINQDLKIKTACYQIEEE